mmetsp:Transcript_41777/g.91123  ORF Transcript_41777/g.91123 Transcript_41777/m.91123 type:complete len:213 (-) Transcript_41777:496-1134(-)
MVSHLVELGHVPLQDLAASGHVRKVNVLLLPVASGEDLQLGLDVSHQVALRLEAVTEDVCEALNVLGGNQRLLVVLCLHARRLVAPKQPVHAHLRDFLHRGLHAKVSKLPEVVVEGMLPRHLSGVRADVADNASDPLVGRPGLRQLRLGKRLHKPLHRRIHWVDPEIVAPLLEGRNGALAHQRWFLLQFVEGFLRDLVVYAKEDEGVRVEIV